MHRSNSLALDHADLYRGRTPAPPTGDAMKDPHLPPTYVSAPVPIAYAYDVDDAVLVTMFRLLGLCWNCGRTAQQAAAAGLAVGRKGGLLSCSRCLRAVYCSPECQKIHWKQGGHKATCTTG